MSEAVLKVDRLTKKFSLNRNALGDQSRGHNGDVFYAIREVSFEIKKGEICGLIGRNGAGKTTLLELLSGIIKPSEGEITIYGKTASVIDIGTGMHRDLSGYENVFLAGELLGMERSKIKDRLQEIIDFSELAAFIHLPIKHYSSGMFMRLAFSVITHLDADILLIDEIIGVGDMAFSEKTTAKIIEICKRGKSAIIATHSLTLVKACCTTAVYMRNGVLVSKGRVDEVEELYLEDVIENKSLITSKSIAVEEFKQSKLRLQYTATESVGNSSKSISLISAHLEKNASDKDEFSDRDQLNFELQIDVKDTSPFVISIHINHHYNQPALCLTPQVSQTQNLSQGRVRLKTFVPSHLLNQGLYTVSVFIVDRENVLINSYENVLIFKIELDELTKKAFGYSGKFSGPIFRGADWIIGQM